MPNDSRRMFLMSIGCLGALCASSAQTLAQAPSVRNLKTEGKRIITIYFSWAGSCRDVAHEVQRLIGGDLVELKTQVPYPAKYEDTVNRAKAERKANLRPPLQPIPDLSGYDIVCIGHPIWSGSMPMALYGFFESQDLSGKTLVHFNTEGLDFVMTAMFVVIFLEQWLKEKNHTSALAGLGISLLCLAAFGEENFIIPSMAGILIFLSILRRPLEKGGAAL